uniref:Uncharacterized protein n=1 Tax=Arundo donax TaxID=35708 RepID=A0A0A8Z078_ARUDO
MCMYQLEMACSPVKFLSVVVELFWP